MEAIVSKGGERWLEFTMAHTKGGMEVLVKVHPKVEEYMRTLGDGKTRDAEQYGPGKWASQKPGNTLSVYNLSPDYTETGDEPYTMMAIGKNLRADTTVAKMRGNDQVNLSFLRLKGISEGPGVTFMIKLPHSYGEMVLLKKRIGQAFGTLCKNHILPARVTLTVSSQEIVG